jgi:subtilisin family serine protease
VAIPASYPQVLTVTAVYDSDGRPGALGGLTCSQDGSDDAYALFSNFGWSSLDAEHTIAAPGVCINSTWHRRPFYFVGSGTSTASPHAAGLVALCIGEVGASPGPCADRSPADVIAYMRAEARAWALRHPDFGFWGEPDDLWPRYYGYLVHYRPPDPAP